ncbi:SNX14 [Acanthosepion pharaonis]|uniref:SNX14 n=1 Tax=Acanthosepion pharaonis TaxID=158019 RepID=A0A812EWT3_ACAPH|nr:SNX14 [Sepia pharaonis]
MPQLQGSELLYNFLTSKDELTSSFLPDINIGKIVKSVPMKLVKERGQHIDPFLQSFLQSTEAPKPRPIKLERKGSDTSLKSVTSEKFYSPLYENNFNCESSYPLPAPKGDLPEGNIEGVFNMLIYLARNVYHIPEWFHHVLITCRMLLKRTMESYLDYYIEQKFIQVMQENRLMHYIEIIKHVLFFDTDPPRTEDQKRERRAKTLYEMKKYIPGIFVYIMGDQNHHEGTKLILDILQQPKLNKQLSYVLLDIVILELFPELKETYSPDTRLQGPEQWRHIVSGDCVSPTLERQSLRHLNWMTRRRGLSLLFSWLSLLPADLPLQLLQSLSFLFFSLISFLSLLSFSPLFSLSLVISFPPFSQHSFYSFRSHFHCLPTSSFLSTSSFFFTFNPNFFFHPRLPEERKSFCVRKQNVSSISFASLSLFRYMVSLSVSLPPVLTCSEYCILCD